MADPARYLSITSTNNSRQTGEQTDRSEGADHLP